MRRISTRGQRFIDESGAEVFFSGVNLVCKDKQKGYVEAVDENTFKWFKECGFNLLRLGLEWDGVEPSPMSYDDDYLYKISRQIKLAEDYGIYVYLDMHQDLYSSIYGNGAPAWATLSDNQPHVTGDVWSDAYLISPAVQHSFDNFWANSKVDGIGLQDYYAKMWGHIAEYMLQFGFTNIIGYDIMNEPSMGSKTQEVMGALLEAYAKRVLNIENPDISSLAGIWFEEGKKEELLSSLSNMVLYKELIKYASVPSAEFERDVLSPFYCKVAKEIRRYDKSSVLLLESNYFCNMGIESGIEAVVDENGCLDKNQAYAPHGYDLVVDTDNYGSYNNERVRFIFETHQKTAQRLNVPIVVGEWGAFYGSKYEYDLSKDIVGIFEGLMFSNTYWSYTLSMEKSDKPNALKRGYPKRSTCTVLGYSYDYDSEKLKVDIKAKGEYELTVFDPKISQDVAVSGSGNGEILSLLF